MPRKVDHDERRLQIAKIVEELVYEHGVQALTIRDVAARVGCSTTVVSHYFRTKLEMLVFTHREVRKRAEAVLVKSLKEGRGLVSTIELLLPTTEEGWRNWHTWFSFWGMAPADPSVSQEWIEGTSDANQLFVQLILAAQEAGAVDRLVDAAASATELQVLVNGIASLVIQDRASWPPERQRALLRSLLGKVLGPKLANC